MSGARGCEGRSPKQLRAPDRRASMGLRAVLLARSRARVHVCCVSGCELLVCRASGAPRSLVWRWRLARVALARTRWAALVHARRGRGGAVPLVLCLVELAVS